jgi:hypothetical protein
MRPKLDVSSTAWASRSTLDRDRPREENGKKVRAFRYTMKLLKEFMMFSKESGSYWMMPLFILLGLLSILVVGGEAVAPLIYALF